MTQNLSLIHNIDYAPKLPPFNSVPLLSIGQLSRSEEFASARKGAAYQKRSFGRFEERIRTYYGNNDYEAALVSSNRASAEWITGFTEYHPNTAPKSTNIADIIYRPMCDFDQRLPDFPLRPIFIGRLYLDDQLTLLPYHIHCNFRKRLELLADTNPRLCLAVAAVYAAALRLSEAAAIGLDSFQIHEGSNIVSILVHCKIQDGERKEIPQNSDLYRRIPLCAYGNKIMARCRSFLPTELNPDEPFLCDIDLLASTIKELLIESGVTSEYLEEIMCASAKYSFAALDTNIYSALLRSDWLVRAYTICYLSFVEMYYLLGYEITINRIFRDSLHSVHLQEQLANKLARYECEHILSDHLSYTFSPVGHSFVLAQLPPDPAHYIQIRDSL